MNTVSGKVLAKETGIGVPNLLVTLYDSDSGDSSKPPGASVAAANRIGSVLTDAKGDFELSFEAELFAPGDPEKRPDLVVGVFAPEDSQGLGQPTTAPPQQRLLVLSNVPRQNAGRMEAYVLRVPTAQLEHFSIPFGNGAAGSADTADSVLAAWEAGDAARERLKPRVVQEIGRVREVKTRAKALFSNLSAVAGPLKQSPFFVRRGEAHGEAQAAAIEHGITRLSRTARIVDARRTSGRDRTKRR